MLGGGEENCITFTFPHFDTKVCRVDILWRGYWQYYFRLALMVPRGNRIDFRSGKFTGTTQFERCEFAEQSCLDGKIAITKSDPAILPESSSDH